MIPNYGIHGRLPCDPPVCKRQRQDTKNSFWHYGNRMKWQKKKKNTKRHQIEKSMTTQHTLMLDYTAVRNQDTPTCVFRLYHATHWAGLDTGCEDSVPERSRAGPYRID